MRDTAKQISRAPRAALAKAALSAAALTVLALLALAPAASADYEQVPEHFGVSGEAEQLKKSQAMAINVDGAGGVQAGSIYVVGINNRVVRYSPGSEGEAPAFREAWGWGIGDGAEEFQRCGPAYAAEPRPAGAFASCRPAPTSGQGGNGGEQIGHFSGLVGVAVNRASGEVYVLNARSPNYREHHLIEVFSPTGEPVGEGFGDSANPSSTPPESIEESPEKLHKQGISYQNGIAVDEAGVVYVIDQDFPFVQGIPQRRIMSFEPESPGDYEHYVYAGRAKDIDTGPEESAHRISLVGSNRLVAASGKQIREYPTGGGSTPLCEREVTGGEAVGMAANPDSGEVFFFVEGRISRLRRLGPCDEASGKFEELQAPVVPEPTSNELLALAVNPSLAWGPLRPAGVLYAADTEEHSGTPVQRGIGDVFAPVVEHLFPVIESESVVATNSSSTTLQARIDPRNQTTEYSFQYLTQAQYEANPPADRFAGAAETPVPRVTLDSTHIATAPLTGLSPETAYRFRAIARNRCNGPEEAPCEASGEAASFATYPIAAPGLPDGRAYELVSPAQKQGGEVFPAHPAVSSCPTECKPPGIASYTVFPMQSAPNGDAVSYMGFPFSPEQGAATFNSYISRRSSAGWQTTAMSPRRLSNTGTAAYSRSLGEGLIADGSNRLSDEAPSGYPNLYLQDAGSPAALRPLLSEALFEALAPSGRPYREAGSRKLEYAGHSPDFAAQYFSVNDSLTFAGPYAPEPPDPGFTGKDLYESRAGRLSLVNVLPGNAAVATEASFASASPDTHAVSADGRRVFWEAGGRLYVREDGRRSVEVDDPGHFLTASTDGSQVLLSDGCLYSLQTTECAADLTQEQGGFQGIAGASEDLSKVYFTDTAALAGENERGEEAQAGEDNLYLHESGGGTTFIATLASTDGAGGGEYLNDWATNPGARTAEASPDGRFLAFASTAQLTGYGNVGLCALGSTESTEGTFVDAPCKEVFLYDSASGRLSCPSCNPSGEAPHGNSTLRRIASATPWLPQPRYLTNRGRLFFDSGDRLSVRDTNGRVEDVYEYEPDGVGSCTRAQGCVTLISPGSGEVDSNFLSMGGEGEAEGSDVFFTTRERLVPIDTDELIDLYDARVGGGFASETETTRPECQGEACQPAPNPPAEVTPASAAFQGAGNLQEGAKSTSRCPKGKRKVKSRGKTRCVAKHHKKRHKRHHKRHRRKHSRANADRRAHR